MANSFNTSTSARIIVKTDSQVPGVSEPIQSSADAPFSLRKIATFFDRAAQGASNTNTNYSLNPVAAAGLITFSSFVNADTITIGVTTLTGSSTLQDTTHFKIGGTDTITAANAVTTILANTTLQKFVTATSSANTVLVTAIVPGYVGNFVPLAISAHGSVSGSVLGTGTGSVAGTEGTNSIISLGL